MRATRHTVTHEHMGAAGNVALHHTRRLFGLGGLQGLGPRERGSRVGRHRGRLCHFTLLEAAHFSPRAILRLSDQDRIHHKKMGMSLLAPQSLRRSPTVTDAMICALYTVVDAELSWTSFQA